jgi:putative intracellular protease/amidase/uncharacterized protein (DUF952 family)
VSKTLRPRLRWMFHVVRAEELGWGKDGRYAPASLETEGFIHASYKDRVRESARLYFAPGARLRMLAIDPRRLDVPVDVVETPRGPMPHIKGPIPCDAFKVLDIDAVDEHPDRVTGTRFGFFAFAGMTLLDLVGPLDALSRIVSMGFDETTSVEVVALTKPEDDTTVVDVTVWMAWGAEMRVQRYRPALDSFDVLVMPGGPGTRRLVKDEAILDYLRSFPQNRLFTSVCTGSLLLGAAGRLQGKRATTHASALEDLGKYGAEISKDRVVDDGQIVTAGGVTAGIDLGLHLVRRLAGEGVAVAIAKQMEVPG